MKSKFIALLLLSANTCYADLTLFEMKDVHRLYQENRQHYSLAYTIAGLETKQTANVRFFGEYGSRQRSFPPHPQIKGDALLRDCPQNPLTAFIQWLYPSPDGVNFVPDQSKTAYINQFTLPLIGAILNQLSIIGDQATPDTVSKNQESWAKSLAILIDESLHPQIYSQLKKTLSRTHNDKEKKVVEEKNFNRKKFQEALKFSQLLVNAWVWNRSHDNYPAYYVEHLLQTLACKKGTSKADLIPYFQAMPNIIQQDLLQQLPDSWSQDLYTKADYQQVRQSFGDVIDLEAFNQLITSPERALLLGAGYQYFDCPFSPIIYYGAATYNLQTTDQNKKTFHFSDCGETAILNLLNMFTFNRQTKVYDIERLNKISQAYNLQVNPKLIEFYKKYSTPRDMRSEGVHNDWAQVVSNLPSQAVVAYNLPHENPVCEIQSYLSNHLHVVSALLGDQELNAIERKKLSTQEKALEKLNRLAQLFSDIGNDSDCNSDSSVESTSNEASSSSTFSIFDWYETKSKSKTITSDEITRITWTINKNPLMTFQWKFERDHTTFYHAPMSQCDIEEEDEEDEEDDDERQLSWRDQTYQKVIKPILAKLSPLQMTLANLFRSEVIDEPLGDVPLDKSFSTYLYGTLLASNENKVFIINDILNAKRKDLYAIGYRLAQQIIDLNDSATTLLLANTALAHKQSFLDSFKLESWLQQTFNKWWEAEQQEDKHFEELKQQQDSTSIHLFDHGDGQDIDTDSEEDYEYKEYLFSNTIADLFEKKLFPILGYLVQSKQASPEELFSLCSKNDSRLSIKITMCNYSVNDFKELFKFIPPATFINFQGDNNKAFIFELLKQVYWDTPMPVNKIIFLFQQMPHDELHSLIFSNSSKIDSDFIHKSDFTFNVQAALITHFSREKILEEFDKNNCKYLLLNAYDNRANTELKDFYKLVISKLINIPSHWPILADFLARHSLENPNLVDELGITKIKYPDLWRLICYQNSTSECTNLLLQKIYSLGKDYSQETLDDVIRLLQNIEEPDLLEKETSRPFSTLLQNIRVAMYNLESYSPDLNKKLAEILVNKLSPQNKKKYRYVFLTL